MTTKYVLFIDNDVLVEPGWLSYLLDCAEENGATIVGPLYLLGEDSDPIVHMAGATCDLIEENGVRRIVHEMHFLNKRLSEVPKKLTKQATGGAEFHCMLVRRDIFDRVGLLDEALLTTREHLDLCLLVKGAGGTIWFEPASIITYIPVVELHPAEAPYFFTRWSKEYAIASMEHFERKWKVELNRERQLRVIERRRNTVQVRQVAPNRAPQPTAVPSVSITSINAVAPIK